MKTLLVGDLHLKSQIILPLVKEKVFEKKCERVILIGDYMDSHGQNLNAKLYAQDLIFLIEWKKDMIANGTEVITLVGNHDAPYLIDTPANFSVRNEELFFAISDNLYDLGVQIAYKLGDYIVSHAGIAEGFNLDEQYFRLLNTSDIPFIEQLQTHVGFMRGGEKLIGSPLWADYTEIKKMSNPKYPKQIFGHTPQKNISLNTNLVGIDTFSVYPFNNSWEFIGNGDILLHDNNKLSIVKTNWQTKRNIEQMNMLFQV